ncbi:MAG TPA: glycosyltransferase [Ilumatobacteraceae bacterium]
MKIALLSEHASPLAALGEVDSGGQNVYVRALALHLAKLGHDVCVYTRRSDKSAEQTVQIAPRCRVRHVDAGPARHVPKDDMFPLMDDFAESLAAIWRHQPPDVIHAHFWMSGYAAMLARQPDVPVLQTFHALGTVKRRHQAAADTSTIERLTTEERLVREADAIVATCTDEREELVALGASPSAIEIIPCGVESAIFQPRGPATSRSARSRVVVTSRLVPRKGIQDAVAALRLLPTTELVVVGGPPADELPDDDEYRRLVTVARHDGVADRVLFTGGLSQSAVAAWMRSADAVIAAPWYEPFGIVPVEAMACGVPVIGSAVGGLLDTVADGRTGFLVEPRDPEAIADRVNFLLTHPRVRARMSRAAIARAAVYQWPRIAHRVAALYARAVAARNDLAATS